MQPQAGFLQSIIEFEVATLQTSGPSLGSFAHIGKSDFFRLELNSSQENFSFGPQPKSVIELPYDINNNIRAFYYCLMDYCYSPITENPKKQAVLENFKREAYICSIDMEAHDLLNIPVQFIDAYRNECLRKILVQFLQVMNYSRGQLLKVIETYPIVDCIMISVIRCLTERTREKQWKRVPNQHLVEVFRNIGLGCFQNQQNYVVFPQNQLTLVESAYECSLRPELRQEMIGNGIMLTQRSTSIYSIELSDSEINQQKLGQYSIPPEVQSTEPNIKMVDSIYSISPQENVSFGKRQLNLSEIQPYDTIEGAFFSLKDISIEEEQRLAKEAPVIATQIDDKPDSAQRQMAQQIMSPNVVSQKNRQQESMKEELRATPEKSTTQSTIQLETHQSDPESMYQSSVKKLFSPERDRFSDRLTVSPFLAAPQPNRKSSPKSDSSLIEVSYTGPTQKMDRMIALKIKYHNTSDISSPTSNITRSAPQSSMVRIKSEGSMQKFSGSLSPEKMIFIKPNPSLDGTHSHINTINRTNGSSQISHNSNSQNKKVIFNYCSRNLKDQQYVKANHKSQLIIQTKRGHSKVMCNPQPHLLPTVYLSNPIHHH